MTLQNTNKTPAYPSKRWVKRLIGLASTLLFTAALHAQPMSGTYTVCPSGSGSCDYTTVTDAINDLNSNGISGPVIIDIGKGTYVEKGIQLGSSTSGVSGVSATNTITIKGAGRFNTTITESEDTYGAFIFMVYYTDHVIIKDLDIYNSVSFTSYNEVFTLCLYYSDNCKVQNSLLRNQDGDSWDDYGQYPIYSYGCSNTLYEGNWIRGGYYGFYHYGSGNTFYGDIIRNNRFTRSFNNGVLRQYRYGDLIEKNFFDSCLYAIESYEDNASIYDGNIVNGNGPISYSNYMEVGMMFGYPAEYYTSQPLVVKNNIIKNVYRGIDAYSWNWYPYTNFDVYHNTIMQRPDASSWDFCMYYQNGGYAYGYDIRNNIFYPSSSGGGISVYSIVPSSGDIIDGNNYSVTNGPVAEVSYNPVKALADFQNNYGVEANGTDDKVTFKSSADLHLDQNTAAPSAPYIGVDKDFDGDSRCQMFPTVGADENNVGKGPFKAKIFAPSVVYDSSPTTFYNSAKATEPKIHRWYINGSFVTSEVNLSTTLSGSSHVISLATTGCGGYDSTFLNVNITVPATTPNSDFVANKNNILQGEVVQFTDITDLGPTTWKWDIKPKTINVNGSPTAAYKYINGTSDASQNPVVQFNFPGKFEACLTASNVKGAGSAECKKDYVDVFPVMNMGQETETRYTQGTLYDDGGPNNGVMQYGKTKLLINACAEDVFLVIKKFDLYCAENYLRIYDGDVEDDQYALHPCTTNSSWYPSTGLTGGPSGWSCIEQCIPSPTDTFVAQSGKMLIVQDINYNWPGGSPGFEASWWSTPKTVSPPVASFTVADTNVCQNGLLTFINTSTGEDNKYYWDLDGDPNTIEANDDDETLWLFTLTGTQYVTLTVENCGGTSTFTQALNVFVPNKPTVKFQADNTNPTTDDIVFMTSTIEECVDDFEWVFTNTNNSSAAPVYMNGTTKFSDAPQVILPEKGCWNVTLKATNMGGDGTLTQSCYINVKDAYCKPSAANNIADIGIAEVAILSSVDSSDLMRNSSTQAARDYTSYISEKGLAINAEIGVTYILDVARNTSANNITFTAWVDWNLDGDFDDPAEEIGELSNSPSMRWMHSFTIPIIAKTGATVLRIASNLGNYPNEVCGQNRFGEYEDYRLYVTNDQTAPVITLYNKSGGVVKAGDTLVIEQGRKYVEYGFKAIDNLDGDITPSVTTDTLIASSGAQAVLNTFVVRDYIVTYDVMDGSTNQAKTAQRIVRILKDTTAPTLEVQQPVIVYVDVDKAASFQMPAVTKVDDIVDGIQVTQNVEVYNNGVLVPSVDAAVVDTYEVIFSATDDAGNTTMVKRTIIVQDLVAPKLTLKGPSTIQHPVFTSYSDENVEIWDNYYDTAMLRALHLQMSSNVDENVLGTYLVTYTIADPSGNGPVTITRTVEVVDKDAPEVTFKGSDSLTLDVNTVFSDPVFTVFDNYYENKDIAMDRDGSLLGDLDAADRMIKVGSFDITYTFTDGSGNVTSVPFIVNVVDRIAPEVDLKSTATVSICRWASYEDAGYLLNDNYYQDSTDFEVEVEGSFVNTDLEGLYDLRYKITDPSGNVGYSPYRAILVKSPDQMPCITGVEGSEALDNLLSVYPNPSSGVFTVKVDLQDRQQLRITVMNLLGEEISLVEEGQVMNGVYTVDLSAQASGVYLLKVQGADRTFTKRIVINK